MSNVTHMSPGIDSDLWTSLSLLFLCYTSGIIFQLFPGQLCWHRFMHQSEHSLSLLPLTSIINKTFNCKFKLDKAAELHYKPAPSCILSRIVLLHLWMLVCYKMQHLLQRETGSYYLFKWKLHPEGLSELCMFWMCLYLSYTSLSQQVNNTLPIS